MFHFQVLPEILGVLSLFLVHGLVLKDELALEALM